MSANENADTIKEFQQPVGNETPRKLLMRVLQDVDQIDEIIIVGRKKNIGAFCSGSAGVDRFGGIALLEAFKFRMLAGIGPHDD